ncbi:MAG TPA: exodeoxyribonuclease III [Candidatus Binatia bacterium]|nr:exodeoxyribonuclease III [Candidatus Binatia bacterium]
MHIATWNVNSIRARKERVLAWVMAQQPDVLCLQETKVTDDTFPRADFEALGYHVITSGQRTYNGVAILSRTPPAEVSRVFADGGDEQEARFLTAGIAGVRVVCVYVPNGQVVGGEKFADKLSWFGRLRRYLDHHCDPGGRLALCGDLNVAPEPRDVHDPAAWQGTVLFHPQARAALRDLCAWGLVDAFRLHHSEGGLYSWWDYRQLSFPKNHGLRIDHILVTPPLAAHCTGARIDRETRKGQGASDHAPVLASFSE